MNRAISVFTKYFFSRSLPLYKTYAALHYQQRKRHYFQRRSTFPASLNNIYFFFFSSPPSRHCVLRQRTCSCGTSLLLFFFTTLEAAVRWDFHKKAGNYTELQKSKKKQKCRSFLFFEKRTRRKKSKKEGSPGLLWELERAGAPRCCLPANRPACPDTLLPFPPAHSGQPRYITPTSWPSNTEGIHVNDREAEVYQRRDTPMHHQCSSLSKRRAMTNTGIGVVLAHPRAYGWPCRDAA